MIYMKSRIIAPVLSICLLLNIHSTVAQVKKLKNVINEFTLGESPDVGVAKFDIDLVTEDEETRNMAATWGWRGIVYTAIATDPKMSNLDAENKATKVAGESFIKYYEF